MKGQRKKHVKETESSSRVVLKTKVCNFYGVWFGVQHIPSLLAGKNLALCQIFSYHKSRQYMLNLFLARLGLKVQGFFYFLATLHTAVVKKIVKERANILTCFQALLKEHFYFVYFFKLFVINFNCTCIIKKPIKGIFKMFVYN